MGNKISRGERTGVDLVAPGTPGGHMGNKIRFGLGCGVRGCGGVDLVAPGASAGHMGNKIRFGSGCGVRGMRRW